MLRWGGRGRRQLGYVILLSSILVAPPAHPLSPSPWFLPRACLSRPRAEHRHFADRRAVTPKLEPSPQFWSPPPTASSETPAAGHPRSLEPGQQKLVYRRSWAAGQALSPCGQTDGSAGLRACRGLLARTTQARATPRLVWCPTKWRPACLCHRASGGSVCFLSILPCPFPFFPALLRPRPSLSPPSPSEWW